ncbi:PepSY domain-containing protein [Brachymonas denitrificans]|uniref:PepSY domain-containing protein n=1 Tax=Brachymonas denitrificans TaxID=28220 RepID=UPI001BD0A680|nr:PepSY domain-containing protein [Brachymonas denitrificans]
MKRNTSIAALIAAATIATAGGFAYAGQDGKRAGDRYDELLTSKITLQHAIASAQLQHPDGRVIKAELEQGKDAPYYEVDVVTPDKSVVEVRVDATDGKVIASDVQNRDARKDRQERKDAKERKDTKERKDVQERQEAKERKDARERS